MTKPVANPNHPPEPDRESLAMIRRITEDLIRAGRHDITDVVLDLLDDYPDDNVRTCE